MKTQNTRLFHLLLAVGLIAILSSCSSPPADGHITLQSLGPAPELENEVWINTDQSLRLADLRGSVVLLEMWTYG
jgi:hypothetical protein